MSKILFWGNYIENTGPSNVHRSLIENSKNELDYIRFNNRLLRALEIRIKVLQSDIIIYPSYTPAKDVAWFKSLNKKTITIVHGCQTYENIINKLGRNQNHLFQNEDAIHTLSDVIVCVSEKFSIWYKERYPQYASKITFVNNGVKIHPRKHVEKSPYIVAVSGGNRQIKNNNYVCQAIQKLNEQGFPCQLKIFGQWDTNNEDLSKYPNVTYMNQLNKEEYYEWLDKIPLLILVSELESFGLVIADALNCHCSMLLSNNIGASSILDLNEKDIIKDPHNIEELANRIRYLLEHPNAERLLSSVNIEACSEKQAWINLKSICERL